MDRYLEANRRNWNERVPVHARSRFYDLDGFRSGRSTLHATELEEVGDVSGRSLLHLQCHFGLDTLSWARRGAEVTGVDFSPDAIALARSLARESGIPATFVCAEIGELAGAVRQTFDVVFASYGVLCWIPDVDTWMRAAAARLAPGGFLYLIDGHPMAGVFSDTLEVHAPYFQEGPIKYPGATYTDGGGSVTAPSYEWSHGLGEIVTAAVAAGLALDFVHEFPFCEWERLPGAMEHSDGVFRMRHNSLSIPLTFSLRASFAAA